MTLLQKASSMPGKGPGDPAERPWNGAPPLFPLAFFTFNGRTRPLFRNHWDKRDSVK
mgnify:FL=1|jgi:hypothetical protein